MLASSSLKSREEGGREGRGREGEVEVRGVVSL